MSFRIHCV